MAASDILDTIEKNTNVEKITTVDGRSIWPLLRQKVVFQEVKKTLGLDNKLRTRNKKQLAINFFLGIKNLFRLRKFDFVFFNNTDKRILLDNAYYDIFFDAWADKVSQEKSLFIEWAKDKHYVTKKAHSSNIISDLPFKLAASLISKFVKPKIENEQLLNQIISKYNISLSAKKECKEKLAELYVFKFLFKIIKPKAIFVLSSFTKVGIVMAAKELEIPVYEAQHGYIGDKHTFYSAEKHFKKAYPDYLFSFGTYEKQKATTKLIFEPEQILPVGSLQLELIKKQPLSQELLEIKKGYDFVFCITLQAIKETEMLDWILKEASLHPSWLFVLRAKNRDATYLDYTTQKNIIECNEFTIYEVLKISDFNITIYSTTAIEGIFLGAKTIFYNINNLSKDHFDIEKMNAITVEEGTFLDETILQKPTHNEHSFFVDDYFQNVKNINLFNVAH